MNATMLMARRYCWELGQGADLASIHSDEENGFVKGLVKGANIGQFDGFWLGLLLTRWNLALTNAQWTDGSPADYGRPPVGKGDAVGISPWYNGILGNSSGFGPEPNNNAGVESCVMLMGQNAGDGAWADFGCWVQLAGFICRKPQSINGTFSPAIAHFQEEDKSYLLLHPLFSLIAIFAQLYVIWLVINKSPEAMGDYRYFLCANTESDMAVSFVIGFLIVPDNWMPDELGATVNGLGRYFGERGGEITLALAIGSVCCQVGFQMFSLVHRFSSVVSRDLPKFSQAIGKHSTRFFMFIFVLANAALIAFLSKNVTSNPQEIIELVQFGNGNAQKLLSDAQLAKMPIIQLNYLYLLSTFVTLIAAFTLIQSICIVFTAIIIRYLRAHSKYFSAHTYKLQLQLIISLLIQLVLPCIFIGIPVLCVLILTLISKLMNGREADDLRPSKQSIGIGIFFFELYALLNPVTIVLFVTPYRRHFAKITGYNWIMAICRKMRHGQQKGDGNNQKTPVIQLKLDKTTRV